MNYMKCKFNKMRNIFNVEVKVGDHIILEVIEFNNLCSLIQDGGEQEWYVRS